jgi:hypothetical protein
MATVTKGKTFASGEVVTPQKMHEMVDLATVTAIVNADVDAAAAIAASKLASTLDLSGKTVTLPAASVTAAMLAATLDISGKTVTLPATSVTAAMLAATLDISGKTVTLPATSVTAAMLAATLDISGKTLTLPAGQAISRPVLTGVREAIVNTGVASGTTTLDLNGGNIFQIKPNGAITIAFSNVPASGTFVGILIRHEGDGTARTYTWPGTTKWAYGEAPIMTSTNGKFDLISLFTYDGGTTYFGQILGQNY